MYIFTRLANYSVTCTFGCARYRIVLQDSTFGDKDYKCDLTGIHTMATIGRIEEFREEKEDWDQYAERLDHFFTANGITGADKKLLVFLTVIGAKAYKQLRSLIAPAKPGEIGYDDLTAAMKKHLTPPPSEIVQRFKFNSRFRQAGE